MTLIKKLKHKFDNLVLKYKLFSILLCNGAMILTAAFASLQLTSSAYNEQLYRAVAGNLSFSSQTIANTLKEIENVSSMVISSSIIQDALMNIKYSDDTLVWANASQDLKLALSTYQQTYTQNGIYGILIYNRAFQNVTEFTILNKMNAETLEQALQRTIQKEGAVSWTIDYDNDLAILGRSVRQISNLDLSHLGDILIFADMNRIVSNANKAVITYTDSQYILYDKAQKQLLYTSPALDSDTAQNFLYYDENEPYQIVNSNGHSYFVIANKLPYYDWSYINLIPYDQIGASLHAAHIFIGTILIFTVVLSLYIAIHMTKHILRDFNQLIDKMDSFSKGLEMSETESQYNHRSDEIGRLHQHFFVMTMRIRELIQKNYVNELLTQEARLKALEAQINPHFLYNTLETINWHAKALGDSEISSMVESLGSLLRATLSNQKKLVPLSQELELVHSYMTIQKIRYEDRLNFKVNYDPSLNDAMIPPLTIQPCLENAIRYGLEEMTETCIIDVHAFLMNDCLIVEISNDGSCFEDHLLEHLIEGSKNAHGFGIGIVNIHQRIQMLFGANFGLNFFNQNNRAVASISIPYTTKQSD